MLWHPDVRWKDFDGQRAVGSLLGKSIQLGGRRVSGKRGGRLAWGGNGQKRAMSQQGEAQWTEP